MDESKPPAEKVASTVRAPLIATIAAIALAGAAYFAFYRSQVEYYTGRNLRLISTLTAQLNGRAALYSGFFRDGVIKPERIRDAKGEETIKRGIEETARGWAYRLEDEHGVSATIPLDLLLQPIFARRVSSAFDMVLIADAAGQILFSLRTPPPASSLLGNEDQDLEDDDDLSPRNASIVRNLSRAKKERESGAALSITRLGALLEKRGWREYTPLNPASLLVATSQTRVRLGDDEYLLFTQPYTFAHPKASIDNNAKQLIVCGLVAAPRFRYSVTAVSVSIVFIATGVALLALCCWPFLRIALIHPSQELTLTDVALLVICTAVGACVLTLAVLDIFAYRALAKHGDAQLEAFSETVVRKFEKNVKGAMDVLNRAEKTLALPPAAETATRPMPPELRASAVFASYPYVDAIAWMDAKGKQLLRYAAQERDPVPLADIGFRQYFRDALSGRTWTVGDQPYVLEWVRSRTTGEVRAVLAKRIQHPSAAVVALSTDLIDLSHAVRPPGVQFAIIEENGEVVYHSDSERIGFENLFAETDRNRDLRSAVLARHATAVDASYWGEDQSMFVRPLEGSPWTLVTFRAKRLARVLNVEAALLTLVLLLLAATPYLMLYIVTLVAAPRYRAPSIWPDEPRRLDYLRLCIIFLALLLLFGLTTYVLTPWSAFYAVLLIPTIATLSTYLVLHRSTNRRRFAIAAALWIVANAALFVVLLRYDVAQGRFFSDYPRTAHFVLVAVAIVIAALTAVLMSTSRGKRQMINFLSRVRLGYAHLYRLCGVLLLLLCTTLPVAAFFNISRDVQWELLVKYGQLRAAADLEQRIVQLERLNVQSSGMPADVTSLDIDKTMFGSVWNLALGNVEPCRPPAPTADWIKRLLPALYEDSTAIRPLFEDGSADCLWRWRTDNQKIRLFRKVRFDPDVSNKIWPNAVPKDQIEITTPRTSSVKVSGSGNSVLPAVLCSLGLLAVFWYATGFIASRVLLIDVSEPDWMARLPLSPTLGDHIFLVRRDKDLKSIVGSDPTPFLDVSFEEIARAGDWDAALARLDSSASGRNVRIVDFEHGIYDDAVSVEKLRFLERLLALPDRTVVVISTFTPAFVLTAPPPKDAPADYLARWRALLDRFVVITAEELELRHQEWQRRKDYRTRSRLAPSEPKNWLEKETAYNPFLRRLREELEPEADRSHLLDEIGERAETYYAGLWSSCRTEEKLLLFQLAHNGLANGRNRRALRRLIARGLVRRGPNIELFSETFRLYVLAAAQRENLVSQAKAEYGNSTWDMLRIPFFVIIIAFLLLLFATQKDLLTTTTALATALTTGLPVIMKLIGVFAERRSGAPAAS